MRNTHSDNAKNLLGSMVNKAHDLIDKEGHLVHQEFVFEVLSLAEDAGWLHEKETLIPLVSNTSGCGIKHCTCVENKE